MPLLELQEDSLPCMTRPNYNIGIILPSFECQEKKRSFSLEKHLIGTVASAFSLVVFSFSFNTLS